MSLLKKTLKYVIQKFKYPTSSVAFSAFLSQDSSLGEFVSVSPKCLIGSSSVGNYTYIGANCKFERTTIGSFCSIASDVICGTASHPLDYVSTYPGFYTDKTAGAQWFGKFHEFLDEKRVIIGSDVWIGARAIILGGITIADGAVIAAGAVVTKDVPPYAIVGGVPAKIIKYRFTPEVVSKLYNSKWWLNDVDTIRQLSEYITDTEKFINYIVNKS